MKIRITGLKKYQFAGQQDMQLKPITGTGAFNFSDPFAAATPALKKTVFKADGTTETTGNAGPGYTVFEQATEGTPVSQSDVKITKQPQKTFGQQFTDTLSTGYNAAYLYNAAFNKGGAERERDAMVRNRNAQYNQQGENSMDRGNYGVGPTDYGLFRPDQMGVKSPEGQYNGGRFFQIGGSNAETEEYMVPSIDTFSESSLVNPMDFMQQQQPMQMQMTAPQQISTPPVQSMEVNIKPASVALKEQIAIRESGGNYKALPKKKDGSLASSAAGKYQFLWNTHGKKIAELTGVNSKQQFLNSPEAQEKYFDYWNASTLTPYAQKIKQQYNPKQSLDQLKMMIHFSGAQGAMDYFAKGTVTRDAFGTTNSSYVGQMEAGGEYDLTADQIMQIKAMGGDVEFM